MILSTYTKQPAEVKDYDVDYAPWLLPIEDTIDEVTVSIVCLTDPEDTALVCAEPQYTTTYCKFWVSGGTDGARYKLTATVSTVAGRTDESELVFKIRDY